MENPQTMESPYAPLIQEVARLLNLEIRKGQAAFELTASGKLFKAADKMGREAMTKAEQYESDLERTRGLLEKVNEHLPLASFFENHSAAMGRLEGDTVFLLPEIKDEARYLNIALMFGQPLDLKLYLFPQKWYHNLMSAIFGYEDIQLANSRLDPLVVVRASDPDICQQRLTKPDLSDALVELYSEPEMAPIVNDLSIRTLVQGVPRAESVVSWIKLMRKVAAALQAAS